MSTGCRHFRECDHRWSGEGGPYCFVGQKQHFVFARFLYLDYLYLNCHNVLLIFKTFYFVFNYVYMCVSLCVWGIQRGQRRVLESL